MIQIDDMELVNKLGISRELTEFSCTECRILNDNSDYRWAIQLHPPIERDDVMYFKIYDNLIPGEIPMFNSTKCARISLLEPKYIHCTDCSKEEWVLNEDERKHLAEIIDDHIWAIILIQYQDQLEAYNGKKLNLYEYINGEIHLNLEKPDYSKLS